jgi:hypothetical protein
MFHTIFIRSRDSYVDTATGHGLNGRGRIPAGVRSRDSYVDTATGHGLNGWGSNPGWRKIFLFSTTFRPALGPTQTSIQWVPIASYPAVKRQRREADHSPPSSVEIGNGGAIPPLPHISS